MLIRSVEGSSPPMESGESPAVARRRVRLALRRAREAKSLTQQQVADSLEWSLSKVNRIESGDVTVSNTDLRALLDLFGITAEQTIRDLAEAARTSRRRGWWDEPSSREHLSAATLQVLQFETEASTIRTFQPTIIPGMLQTHAYAAAVLDVYRDEMSQADLDARLEIRLRRAPQVLDRPDPPDFVAIIDESVVWREVGGRKALAEQLQALLSRMSAAHFALRILPFTDAAAKAQMAAFTLYDLGDEEDAVLYREKILVDEIVHSLTEISRHRTRFDEIWQLSLSEEASARLIRARIATLLASLDRNHPTG